MKKLIVIFLLTISSISFAINNIDTFKKFKKPKMRVLLIANQDYDGKDMDLSFTINDMTIYKTIFKELLGVPKGNITFIKNLSSGNFDETMKDFIEDIDKDDLVVIIYAGHGSTNGMPVLTDKKTISVNDFHKHFNSFKNDTILIMDSCYSGAEGEISSQSQSGADGGRGVGVVKKTGITIIKDKDVDEKHTFRENVVRIYSSLAHQESREGKFKDHPAMKPYLEGTYNFLSKLGYNESGNGIFTILFASFFADFNFNEENFNLYTLNSFINTKISVLQEKGFPNQRPKMHPFDNIPFTKRENKYLLYTSFTEKPISEEEMFYRRACARQNDKNYKSAINMFKDSLNYKDSKIRLADCYVKIGVDLRNKAKYKKAIKMFKNALKYNSDSVDANNDLGITYMIIANYSEAMSFLEKAKELAEKTKNEKQISVFCNNIGALYYYKGDYNKALEYYTKALNISEKVYGKEHPDTAAIYSNIGMVYDDKGDYDKALEYYTKALKIAEKVYGIEHPDTAVVYSNIGAVYNHKGQYDKALEYQFKALNIREKVYGIEHPNTAFSYGKIGSTYSNKGQYDKALEYYTKALSINEKVYGIEHPDTAATYNNIGVIFSIQKHYDKALEYYFKALKIAEKVYGKEHSHTATSYNNIGAEYSEKGSYDKALKYYTKALTICKKVFGNNHPGTAQSYNNIGVTYYYKGQYDKALEHHIKALNIREKVYGIEHPDTAVSYKNIGINYYKLRQYSKAEEYTLKCITIQTKFLGDKDHRTKNSYSWLRNIYQALGDNVKAKYYDEKSK